MARLRFGRPISLRWNGLLIEGPANTVFEIPDEYYEEFNQDIGPVEPTLVWLDSDEGATLRGRVTALEGAGSTSFSNDPALALGTASAGVGTEASRDDHVHPTTGLALSGHNHDGSYATTGHNHNGTYEPTNTAILKSIVDAKGDLIVGTAADTVGRLPGSGTNGYVLTYDSAETTGIKWAVAPGAGGGAPVGTATPLALGTASAGDDSTSSREDHVHPTTGLALSGHDHDAAYAPIGDANRADIVFETCKNSSGGSIAKGKVVYIDGSDGTNPTIALADADSEATSSKTLGFTETASNNGDQVNVITHGRITNIDTSAASTEGVSVWLSGTAGGVVFGAPPSEPAHSVYLGVVTKKNVSTGEIFVKVQNGYELDELHDVSAATPDNNDVLQFVSSTGMWTKKNLASAGIAASSHNHSGVYDPAGTASSAISTHVGESDPHTQYLTETAASSTYSTTSHNHSGVYANSSHTHPQSDVTNLTTDLSDKISKTVVDSKGDILVGTSDNTVSVLPVGATSGHVLTVDSSTATGLKWAEASGGSGNGDVVGPSSSIDNALPRFDGTGGKTVQGSSVIVNDSNNLFVPTSVVQSPKAVTESSNTFTINTSNSNYITGITVPAGTAPSVISTASASFGSATTGTLTFGTRATGDIIIVIVGSDNSLPAISSAGWTTITSSSANTTYALVAYKTMGATPDTTISFSGLSGASTASSMVVRNGALNVYSATMKEVSTNTQITPPAVTTVYANELVVTLGGLDDIATSGTVTAAPSGYTNLTSAVSSTAGFATMMSSKVVALPQTYEAPGAYTTSVSETNASTTVTFTPINNSKTITLTGAPSQAITGYSNAVAQTTVIDYSNLGSPVTWSGVSWSGGVAPSIYATGIVTLVTLDGTTYKAAFVDGY